MQFRFDYAGSFYNQILTSTPEKWSNLI